MDMYFRGVYAIALAVSLAICKEPAYLHYDNSKMRPHLLKCLHNGVLTEFPSKPEQRKSLFIKAHLVPLYCSCRMPENGLMFQCTNCQRSKATFTLKPEVWLSKCKYPAIWQSCTESKLKRYSSEKSPLWQ